MTFLLLAFLGAFSTPDSCPAAARRANVVALLPGHTVERRAGASDLARLGSSLVIPGHSMQGLTVTDMTASYETDLRMTRLSNGSWCADVESVEVRIGLASPALVYVARELAEGSCMYREVMAHELSHVSVTESAVRAGAASAGPALGAALAGLPAYGRTSEEASAAALARVGSAVKTVSDAVSARAARDNARLDTPESYARLGSSCR